MFKSLPTSHATSVDPAVTPTGESPRTAGSLGYTPALDGLRAIAVVGVLVSHYGLGSGLHAVERLLPWGHLGVQLFFVLSGLLITSILLNCRNELPPSGGVGATLKVFYARRALRIFPAYYATILLFLVSGSSGFSEVLPYHLVYLSNTVSATYSQTGLAHAASAHFWSLSVEEQFYLIWPLVVLLVPLRWLPLVAIGVVLLAPVSRLVLFAVGYPHIVGYLPTATDALVMGSLLAMARSGQFPQLRHDHRWQWAIRLSLLGFVACLGLYNLGVGYRPREVMLPFFAALVFTGFVVKLLDGGLPRTTALLSWRPLVEVGRVSYAVYLLHTLVMNGLTQVLPGLAAPSLPRFVVATLATIGVALLSWRLFEGPVNDLKRFFPYPSTTPQRQAA